MEILPSTPIAFGLYAALLFLGLQRGLWVFFAMMPLGAAAAFNLPAVGGASFGIREFGVVTVFALVFFRPRGTDSLLGSLRPGQPGGVALLLFLYCVLSAIFVPRVFAGMTDVYTIARSANVDGIRSIPLGPSTGNVTQLFALTLSLAAFLALATHTRLAPDPARIDRAMVAATVVNLALGLLDLLSAAAGMAQLLDVIRTANYSILDEARMMGFKRMIGGFPEASSFGSFSMGLLGYWLHRALFDPRSRTARIMLAVALFCVLRSTSSAAYVAVVLFLAVYGVYVIATQVRAVMSKAVATAAILGAVALWHAAVLIYAAYEAVPPVTAYLDTTVFNKLDSDSGVERMSWNAQAFRNFLETGLIGAGLGSARASNWLLSTLGSVGLPGTLLFLGFLASVFAMRTRGGDARTPLVVSSLKWACAATLVNEVLIASTPNLGVFFFALAGIVTGLARSTHGAAAGPRRAGAPVMPQHGRCA